jgi:hypothetical protein
VASRLESVIALSIFTERIAGAGVASVDAIVVFCQSVCVVVVVGDEKTGRRKDKRDILLARKRMISYYESFKESNAKNSKFHSKNTPHNNAILNHQYERPTYY